MSEKSITRSFLAGCGIFISFGLLTPTFADHVSDTDTKSYQARPSRLGVSGGSQTLLQIKNLLYCYTGTLGALVIDNVNNYYILSNNHVLAKENGNLNSGGADSTIIQQGNLDEGSCSLSSGDPTHAVANLTDFVTIQFGKGRNKPQNTVDGAIAKVVDSNAVKLDGEILGIGTVNGAIDPAVDLAVQKTGRTTAHTFGKIEATDVTIDVSYESGTARFAHQMRIRRPCGDAGFSAAGDSGSLIVTVPDDGSDPQAVGLLFAGSDTDTFANPIKSVLESMSVSIMSVSDGTNNEGAMRSDYDLIANSCPTGGGGGGGGGGGSRHGPPFSTIDPSGLDVAQRVKARHSDEIFALPDVMGHGIGTDSGGNAVIEIYVSNSVRRIAGRHFPTELEGIPVSVIETGVVRAY